MAPKFSEGKLIRFHREYAGVTLKEVAKAIGLSEGMLSRYELGERELGKKSRGKLIALLSKEIQRKELRRAEQLIREAEDVLAEIKTVHERFKSIDSSLTGLCDIAEDEVIRSIERQKIIRRSVAGDLAKAIGDARKKQIDHSGMLARAIGEARKEWEDWLQEAEKQMAESEPQEKVPAGHKGEKP